MSKYTPGPWKIEEQMFPPGHKITGLDRNVCFLPDSGFGQGLEGAANARLIAAAPELLKALKGLMAEVSPVMSADFEPFALAVKAIEKAEGNEK